MLDNPWRGQNAGQLTASLYPYMTLMHLRPDCEAHQDDEEEDDEEEDGLVHEAN